MPQYSNGSFLAWMSVQARPYPSPMRVIDHVLNIAVRAQADERIPASIVCQDLKYLSNLVGRGICTVFGGEATSNEIMRLASLMQATPAHLWGTLTLTEIQWTRPAPNIWNKIPVEIMLHIFLIGVRDERHSTPRPQPFNIVVSHVCRGWRDVTVKTGMMWQFVELSERDPQFRWAKLCLDRAGLCSLDIQINWRSSLYRNNDQIMTNEPLRAMLDLVFRYVRAWRSLSFHANEFPPIHTFLTRLRDAGHAPLLEILILSDYHRPYRVDGPFLPEELKPPVRLPQGIATRLSVLELRSVHLEWRSFPFENLNELSFAYHLSEVQPDVPEFIRILSMSPNLEELRLHGGSGPFRREPWRYESKSFITLHSLRSLELVSFRSAAQVGLIGDLIRAPRLESLRLEEFYGDNFNSSVRKFGAPCSGYSTVTKLRMASVEGTAGAAFYYLLSGLPNVTHLSLKCNEKPKNHVIQCLLPPTSISGPPHPPLIMPMLKTFQVTGVPMGEVLEMLQKRRDFSKSLELLLLDNRDSTPLEMVEKFRALVERVDFFDVLPEEEEEEEDESEDEDEGEYLSLDEVSTGDDSSGEE